MAVKSLAQLKRTKWYKIMVADIRAERGSVYDECVKHALTPGLEVTVFESNEHTGDHMGTVVAVHSDPGFWLAARKTRAEIDAICSQFGWVVKQ